MKKFIAKVNGKEYVVELEEVAGSAPSLAETVRPVNTVPEIKPVQAPAAKAEVKQPEAPAPKKQPHLMQTALSELNLQCQNYYWR
jgi:hypothetical protein